MKWIKLRENLEFVELKNMEPINDDLNILKITHDSRQVTNHSIFVAIKGYLTDGHKYINEAKDRGAKIAIVEEFVDVDISQVKVKNSRIALAELANAFYDFPSKKLKVIGITATNGKTSTAFLLDEILRHVGYTTGIIGTVEIKYPGVTIPSVLTTPESIVLQKHLHAMVERKVDYVIMEVSSSAQELDRVYGIDFDIVSFNNISKEHIEQHGSFERYFEVKSKTITQASHESAAVLNIDYPEIESLKEKTNAQIFPYAFNNSTNIHIENLDLSTGQGKFNYVIDDEIVKGRWSLPKISLPIDLHVAGYHSVMNAVVAITIALLLKIQPEDIQDALSEFRGVERRFELIFDEGFKILDDHFANTKNIEITMETLSQMEFNNLHLLYAIRGSRGAELNEENAVEMVKWLNKLKPETFYATTSCECVSSKDEVRTDELEAFQKVMKHEGYEPPIYDELTPAIYDIISKAEEGDVILFAGCQGMDPAGKIAWKYLIDQKLTKSPEMLRDKIENRIC